VELQAEVDGHRDALFPLVSTQEGLARWLDAANFTAEVGGAVRLTLRSAVAVGEVLALDPPQHVSWSWDWEGEPLGAPSVVAFDLIDHGERTHLTVRHVGLRSREQQALHEELWRYWFGRLVLEARRVGAAEGVGAAPVS
jgi:uncharacterized protein YndB with AHSA1/START domain